MPATFLSLGRTTALLLACQTAFAIPSVAAGPTQHVLADLQPCPGKSIWRSVSDGILSAMWKTQGPSCHTSIDYSLQEPPLATKSRHGDDIVLRFNFSSSAEAQKLAEVADSMYLDVWEHTSTWADIRMAKDTLPHVLRQLPETLRSAHVALMQEQDLKRAIIETYPAPRRAIPLSSDQPPHGLFTPSIRPASPDTHIAETNIFFTDYQPLSVIAPWMRLLASLFTTHVRYVNIGVSYEGRDISALRVGVHPTNNDQEVEPRKTILVMGGIHAREWISVSTVTYVAYSLITGYGKDPDITQLVEDFDWVFIPTINPDGYVYSWEHDRLWRKNRQKTPLRFCFGVDLDKTFPFRWEGTAADNPCSENYAGEQALEGVEARALSAWIHNETEHLNVDFVGLLDLHSYSQQILFPYSYSCDASPPSLENLEELAFGLSKAIRINSGHSYIAKQACEGTLSRFESGGGSALDWFYEDVKVKYPYQIKLRDRGAYGFLLPKEHIVPSGREMLEAALYFGKYVDGSFEGLRHKRAGTRPGPK